IRTQLILRHEAEVGLAGQRRTSGISPGRGVDPTATRNKPILVGHNLVELLDAVSDQITDVDVKEYVHRHGIRTIKLSVTDARAPPLGEEFPIRIKFLHAVTELLGDVDVAGGIHRHAGRSSELSVARAQTTPLSNEVPI